MTGGDWLAACLDRLREAGITPAAAEPAGYLAPARCLVLNAADWGGAARVAAAAGWRHAGLWGDPVGGEIAVHACLARRGEYLVLRTRVPLGEPQLASHSPWFPGVDRLERHAHDLLGLVFAGHPDPRRWTRHQAWGENDFPLRPDFPAAGRAPKRAPADSDYPFTPVAGSAVYEIPVGPVHAGIIEPGHFRFQAVGEEVLCLEERLGYVHKGIEKIAVGRDATGLARLAGRVSGDSTVAHAWAACMALERAAGVVPPPRAQVIRAILAERERIANHLGDIGAICNDVGFVFAHMQCARLREAWQRGSQAVFGHRLLMDRVVPGGVFRDLTHQCRQLLLAQCEDLSGELDALLPLLEDYPALEDRLVETGTLSAATARRLGCLGYVAKASGQDLDARRDHGYAPYNRLRVPSPCLQEGDVAARLHIRAVEIRHSLELLRQLLVAPPGGEVACPWPESAGAGAGLGMVEGWRGEIITYVRLDEGGRVARFFPRDPSWFNWPALEALFPGNIVPDFPVCNKSVNGSYSGQDL
ncbi:MAG TPA: Ni,Fe-hydrogenase III large subunit [Gammaproteobacteria bacterium]|nr:Ni,Fe-hydrogenase III large subunit [Gammaproteobacteria bacterium]